MTTKRWIFIALMLLLLVGCSDDSVEGTPIAPRVPEEDVEPSPTPLPTGLFIRADGVLQAARPVLLLGFESGGKLHKVHVQAGDPVREGDVLAELEEAEPIDSYQAAVTSAELTVLVAQQSLDDLYTNAALNEAEARQAISSAQQVLDDLAVDIPIQQSEALQAIADAQEAVKEAEFHLNSLDVAATETSIIAAQSDVTLAAEALERAETAYAPYRDKPDNNLNKAYYGGAWADAQQAYDAAVRRLNALLGSASDLVRAQKEAELAVAQARLAQAQATYDALSDGIPPADLALAEARLVAAQAAYDALKEGIDPDQSSDR